MNVWRQTKQLFLLTVVPVLVAGLLTPGLKATEQKGQCMKWPWSKPENPLVGNGIAVDQPKVFDDRSLILMADQLSAALSRLTGVDQSRLTQGIGLLQGGTQSDVSRSFSLSTLPLPATVLTQQLNPQSGQLVPQTLVTTNPSFTPTPPSLPGAALPNISPTGFGIASQDVLDEQMQLSYQILNLRLLIERSITDRIHYDDQGHPEQRAQAALGFQVSLDPRKRHKDCAAIVEVEITSDPVAGKSPSLVSLMPQAKTYNVSTLSRSSTDFAASAVVKVVTLGYNEQHTHEAYFLYRDTDTVGFTRQPATDRQKLVFGWEFRPVLNRQVVEPGLRQLFAVVALNSSELASTKNDFVLHVKVRTYWEKFDKQSGAIKPGMREPGLEESLEDIKIPSPINFHEGLGPKITDLKVRSTGATNVVVDVLGNNFYEGTSVVIGEKIYDASNPNFALKDSHLIQIFVPAAEITDRLAVRGRYGHVAYYENNAAPDRFYLKTDCVSIAGAGSVNLAVRLFPQNGKKAPDLKDQMVIVKVGKQTHILHKEDWRTVTPKPAQKPGEDDTAYLETNFQIEKAMLDSDLNVKAVIAFEPSISADLTISNPLTANSVTVLAEDDKQQKWGIIGSGFEKNVVTKLGFTVFADQLYAVSALKLESENLITFEMKKEAAGRVKNVIVNFGQGNFVVLPAPVSKTNSPQPKISIDSTPIPSVVTDSATTVLFTGENLEQVSKVFFGPTSLNFTVEPGPKANEHSLRIFLTRDVTSKKGSISLAIQSKDNGFVAANLNVNNPGN